MKYYKYNVKHKKFRDSEAKNRFWLTLANDMNMDVEVVKKKWRTMRDYFLRSREKKPTGSAASTTSKRDELLSFLVQTSVLKRPTLSSLASSSTQSDTTSEPHSGTQTLIDEDALADEGFDNAILGEFDSVSNALFGRNLSRASTPASGSSFAKRRKAPSNETNDLWREFLAQMAGEEEITWAMTAGSREEIEFVYEDANPTDQNDSPYQMDAE